MINEGGGSFKCVEGNHRGCGASFSNFSEHTNHLETVVKCRFGFSSFGLGPGSPISDKLPADAKTPHLLTTLTLNSKGEDHARNLDFILSETGKKLLKGFKQVSDVNLVVVKVTLVS